MSRISTQENLLQQEELWCHYVASYRPQIVLGAEVMKPKKFEVKIYYSGFCTYQIESKNEAEAIIKARNRQIDSIELLSNLENWKEADTAELN